MAEIRIKAPLAFDVASTLLRLIGTAYPGTTMSEPKPGEAMALTISDEDRGVDGDVIAQAAGIKEELLAELVDVDLTQAGPDGIGMTVPEWLSAILVPMARAYLDQFGGENYAQTQVHDTSRAPGDETGSLNLTVTDPQTHQRYALIVARSPEQTPHKLRLRAEDELESLRAAVRAAHIPEQAKASILGEFR